MGREHYNTLTRIRAVLASRQLYELAATLDTDRPVGRPPVNPPYVVLVYGVLARLTRSAVRVELDLAEPRTWAFARGLMCDAVERHGLDLPPPAGTPPTWDHWRWLRDHHLATDDGLGHLERTFTPIAVATARRLGLLDPHGPGSMTHPDPSRAIYGDGTLIRPMYRPPEAVEVDTPAGSDRLRRAARRAATAADAPVPGTGRNIGYPDPRTGQVLDEPPRRYDPDLRLHHGLAGPVQTHGYVCWHTRGPERYQRVVLAAGHVPEPGQEASTAVALLGGIHRAAGVGVQAVIYDGAMRGTHIDQVMSRYGWLALVKHPTRDTSSDVAGTQMLKVRGGRRARGLLLEPVKHETADGGTCVHQLAALSTGVVEIDLDETGDPVVVSRLERTAVKRARRATGRFHFNVGHTLTCPRGAFTVWLAPHPRHDRDAARPENLRIIAEGDPDFTRLHGLRSDSESFHSQLKRTLLVDRQMSLGWRRGLLDVYCFALLNNAFAEAQATSSAPAATRRVASRR